MIYEKDGKYLKRRRALRKEMAKTITDYYCNGHSSQKRTNEQGSIYGLVQNLPAIKMESVLSADDIILMAQMNRNFHLRLT